MGIKPTCREIHRLTSEGMDRQLSWVERLRMRLHLLLCVGCRRFGEQTTLLRHAVRSASESEP
jgi:hypothetical protein